MNKYCSLLLVLLLLVSACQNQQGKADRVYEQDARDINYVLNRFHTESNIDSLIDLGLYNLAFASIEKNNTAFNDSLKMQFGFAFAENGEFDKALAITKSVNPSKYQYQHIKFSLYCALKKEDQEQAKIYLDSLRHYLDNKANAEDHTQMLLYQAYYEHNIKNYAASIQFNLAAIRLIKQNHLNEQLLVQAYRRLGNDYNDIVRNDLPFQEQKATCLQKGIEFYQRELDLLHSAKEPNKNKIALNYITTAMLCGKYYPTNRLIQYYQKAIENLIVSKNDNFIITRNPLYTSLALSNLGDIYLSIDDKQRMDSSYNTNKDLINVRSFYKVNNKQSLDVWEYFPQISEEQKILYALTHNKDQKQTALQILELSTNCKYANQYLNHCIRNTFAGSANTAIENWILLNELRVYGEQYHIEKISQFATQKLQKYTAAITAIMQQKKIQISNNTLDSLQQWCARNEASIVDYQILFRGSIAMIIIDPSGIQCQWINDKEQLNKNKIQELINSIRDNNITAFQNIAPQIYQHLLVSKITSKRIIICPDDFLEKIPFDALLAENHQHKQWSALNFIGKKQCVQFIPNLSSLLLKNNTACPLQIDLWSSDKDNETLPYNQHLIHTLEQQYQFSKNNATPQNILHVLGHTYRTPENNIEFRLNKDTLSINSNGAVSPKLAILEGCSSGDGKIVKFEGSISQTRCFLYNGTPSVIFSLWDADNQSSTALFKHFYTYLNQGETTSAALNKAKNQLINDIRHPEWANPFYWANFQLTGQDLSFVH
jgi:CHAT domain-containing protein